MIKRKSEGWLRFAFLVAVLTAFSVSALCSHLRKQARVRVWSPRGIEAVIVEADAVPDQADKKRIGLLTYIKRNRKRWLREIKNNPVKWMRFKEKLKKLTAFGQTKKLDKDNQIR